MDMSARERNHELTVFGPPPLSIKLPPVGSDLAVAFTWRGLCRSYPEIVEKVPGILRDCRPPWFRVPRLAIWRYLGMMSPWSNEYLVG